MEVGKLCGDVPRADNVGQHGGLSVLEAQDSALPGDLRHAVEEGEDKVGDDEFGEGEPVVLGMEVK